MKQGTLALNGAAICALAWLPMAVLGQVNSGSNGSDGAFNPTTSTNINMANRTSGIYQYTSVNIPNGIDVTFTPNANNAPVVWLVQGNCTVAGYVILNGSGGGASGGLGGPGGYSGGAGGTAPSPGQGPGGGSAGGARGGGASYGTLGATNGSALPGSTYGNVFLIPLLGGSGGGGSTSGGGGGGGGAILIAASGIITVNGSIIAGGQWGNSAGDASGGAVRLVASRIAGGGLVSASGPDGVHGFGRVRFDTFENGFGGSISGVFSQGYQPVIIPTAGQGAQLNITTLAGAPVATPPSGVLSIPDAIISSGQANPIPVVVSCANIPLGTAITVTVRPSSGATVSAVGYNNSGTAASSTATVLLAMPRGGGIIYATAATGH